MLTKNEPIVLPDIPDNWVWSRCQKLCQTNRAITYGVIKLGPYVEDGVPTLRSSDVRWLYIDDSHIKRISDQISANYLRTILKGGEILVTVRGTLGGVAVVPLDKAGCNISREVAVLPILADLNVNYLSYAIASLPSQNWLSEVTKGVAYTGVNIRDLKQLPLPIPPLSEQHEIVRRVDMLLDLSQRIERRLKTATQRANALVKSILRSAFCGELVPTEAELARREGRDYEPASVLLERIRADREKQKPKWVKKSLAISENLIFQERKAKTVKRKPLEVLKSTKKEMTVEELFTATGCEQSEIDEFYRLLRDYVQKGEIRQTPKSPNPDNPVVYLAAIKG